MIKENAFASMDGDAPMQPRGLPEGRAAAVIDAALIEAPLIEAPLIEAPLIEEWALSYLARYASTAAHLRQVLRRRVRRRGGADPAISAAADRLIEALVARYRETGLLDDAAYAAGRARRDVAQGRSLRRIQSNLAARGVAASDADAALAALREGAADPDLAAACAFARRRRLGPFRTGPAQPQRELAAFARAGFDRRTAEAVLACADTAAISALLAGSNA
jgi:regulatory protein